MPNVKGYSKADLQAVQSPELTDEELAQLRPAKDVLPPALYQSLTRRGPQKGPKKIAVSIRLDADLVAKLRAKGSGWQSVANSVLRKAVGLR